MIFYFPNKNEENVETVFLSINFSKCFCDTAKDIIDISTLIHRAKEMLFVIYNYKKLNKGI